jgi:hypothetical protein
VSSILRLARLVADEAQLARTGSGDLQVREITTTAAAELPSTVIDR